MKSKGYQDIIGVFTKGRLLKTACDLCFLPLPKNPIEEEEKHFCCVGCRTVFLVLSAQKEIKNFQEHPFFKQALSSGLISNPSLLEEIQQKTPSREIEKIHFEIQNMWCPSCAEAIRWILLRRKGILKCTVDYATDWAFVEYDPRSVSKDEVFSQIQKLGYSPQPFLSEQKGVPRLLWMRFATATFCAMNLMMCSYPLYASFLGQKAEGYEEWLGWLSFFLAVPLVTFCAFPIWRRFLVGIQTGCLGMETLIFIGVAAAFVDSIWHLIIHQPAHVYFDSMGMIIVFVLLGKILEKRAKFSAKEALVRLTRLLPKKARRLSEEGSVELVPLKEVKQGDLLIALTGEKIVLDGEVVSGEGFCEEAVMTGESLPIRKRKGKPVIGGSLLKTGSIHYRVTATAEHSLLTRIIECIEKEISEKKSAFRVVDTWTPWFVPIALVIAMCAFLLSGELLRAISVLLISCPCAIGIAAPLTEALWMQKMAEKGVLVRNRGVLPFLAKEALFIFDKTGTLTEGKFQVLEGFEALSFEEKCVLKSLAKHSIHPMSMAISEALEVPEFTLEEVEEKVGHGMQGIWRGDLYRLGSSQWLEKRGMKISQKNALPGIVSQVFFTRNQELVTMVQLGDHLRTNVAEVTSKLNACLLSGDSSFVVESIANRCQIKQWQAGCDPLKKRDVIEKWKLDGHTTIMIGDGVNDAPALAAAHVGISVCSATDLSIQVSDLLLTTDRLDALTDLGPLARKAQKIIKQNIFWAFAYNMLGIPLAFQGYMTPLFAAIAMVASSLCVTFNSLRLNQNKRIH